MSQNPTKPGPEPNTQHKELEGVPRVPPNYKECGCRQGPCAHRYIGEERPWQKNFRQKRK